MQRRLDALASTPFDLLVLGGGITGAGIALDAVTRGLSVALIDKGDFASGTSSISSKLIHGGLRYLEYGDLPLVYEALHERTRLLRNAPHLVWPLPFLLPFRSGERVGPWKWRLGLILYDILAGAGNLRRSRTLPLARLRQEAPMLRSAGLRGAAVFADAQTDDARLVIAVLRSAHGRGAVLANYVEALAFEEAGVRAVDRLRPGGQELHIAALQVVNATGPWGDRVRGLAGAAEPVLAPTQGVHLVVPGRGLTHGFLLLHPRDGRVFFVLPWLGKTLIGTTDTEAPAGPDRLAVTDEDIAYLLEGHNHHLDPSLTRVDVLGHFAGLRPLLRSGPGTPSARSRDFHVIAGPGPLMSVAGGKLTTYRHMAEVVVDQVIERLGLRRPCRTRALRLDGAPAEPWPSFLAHESAQLRKRWRLTEETARHLVQRYGTQARAVAAYIEADAELARPVVEGEPDVRAELAYQRDQEMACTLSDSLLRRTRLGLFYPALLDRGLGGYQETPA
jgi:glycerol-3-phosphate dehydrogenase